MKSITLGILAHVDSGKTTLSEALLYEAGELRRLGRVDHGDAFLDTHRLERDRGITIFSKLARLHAGDTEFTLLDTPGHVDFSAEMERTLQVLDYAVLVISGSEGVQSHTETLWHLLEHSGVPVFLFINKMDLSLRSHEELMQQLNARLHGSCVDFTDMQSEAFAESLAVCDEALMQELLEEAELQPETIAQAVASRHVFPCLFGSALKNDGVKEFLSLLDAFTRPRPALEEFAAKVYKITEDEQGRRLTHMKITGGTLRVRDVLEGTDAQGEPWQEKVNQIRLYSGAKFQPAEDAPAGTVCAVTGLTHTYAGQGLGAASDTGSPQLEPVLRYSVVLPQEIDVHTALSALRRLEEEDPQMKVAYQPQLQEIHVLLMGEIQMAVLRHVLAERFGIHAEFAAGGVAYKETIADKVEGMGHYEPLRHYAEVRLILEPLPQGSGMKFTSICREDALDRNWQRLILTHLQEKSHLGVLTGSPLTDVKISLAAGRAHKKHTEGGDFRQATYRAVRQGLMQAESILLEPWYHFRLEVPPECVGRAITDMQLMNASFDPPETMGEMTLLRGKAPAAAMMTYQGTVMEYTRGRGRLSCTSAGYAPCANAEEVLERIAYQPEADTDNSPDSVFCAHGAGFLVKWDEVHNYMHTESCLHPETEELTAPQRTPERTKYTGSAAQDEELMKIFEQTYGAIKREERHAMHTQKQPPKPSRKPVPIPKGPQYLLVDGYNIIFAWDELKTIARDSLESARQRLIDILSNYQGFHQCRLIVVFDAYKVKGGKESVSEEHGVSIVYTKEAETADMYIERVTHKLCKDARVRVATSDGLEQIIILGNGACRVSAEEFRREVAQTEEDIRAMIR